jgi:hypothetical protein
MDFKSIINDAMKAPDIKSHGQEAAKLIQSITRDLSKLPLMKVSQAEEHEYFKQNKDRLEKEIIVDNHHQIRELKRTESQGCTAGQAGNTNRVSLKKSLF